MANNTRVFETKAILKETFDNTTIHQIQVEVPEWSSVVITFPKPGGM